MLPPGLNSNRSPFCVKPARKSEQTANQRAVFLTPQK